MEEKQKGIGINFVLSDYENRIVEHHAVEKRCDKRDAIRDIIREIGKKEYPWIKGEKNG